MIPSHPDKGNSSGAVASRADKATTQPKNGAPGNGEHRSLSPVENPTEGSVMEEVDCKGVEERIRFQIRLLDAVGQAVIATDLEGKTTYWNRAAEELYGWSKEEVIGCQLAEFVICEDQHERAEEIRAELSAGKSWSGEFIVRRKDGTTFPVMVTDTPVLDEQGNLVGLIGISADITEHKQAEEALRESKERFRITFEDAPPA